MTSLRTLQRQPAHAVCPTQCHLPAAQALTLHLPPLGAVVDASAVRALSLQTLGLSSDELDAGGCPREPRTASAGSEEQQTQLHVVRAAGAGT